MAAPYVNTRIGDCTNRTFIRDSHGVSGILHVRFIRDSRIVHATRVLDHHVYLLHVGNTLGLGTKTQLTSEPN